MPQISNLSFNVSFEPHNPNRVGLINTTPDLPAGFVGIFKVTQPDGYVRNGDINTPDVTNVVSSCVITIVPDSSGQLQQGQYTIEFIGNAPGYLSTSFIRTFTFQYTPATISLRNDFDVFTPQLAYTDISNYNVSGYTISTGPTRRWDATSTTTGTISGTNSSIDIRYNNQYYAETYSIEFRVNVAYVSQAYPWLSITHTRTQTTSVTACIPKSLEDLTQAVEALREESNASCGGDWARFEKANSLYVHLINMLRLVLIAGEHQDGFFDVYQQLLSYIQNGSVACDSIGQVIPPYDFSDYESSIYDGQSSYCQLVGDGVNTVYRVNHQLGDECVVVQVYEVATGKQVFCDLAVSTINSIDITFYEPPTLNQYRVVAVAGALGLRGQGFQPGGLTGQILRKKTNADFDTEWADVTVALPLLVPYSGATQSVYLGEHGIETGYVRFDTTPTTTPAVPAVMSWNDQEGTVDLKLKGNNVTLQIGQEMVARVVNKTGANLLESQYKAVRIRKVSEGGAQGQRLAVVLAQGNTEFESTDMLGIVTENINNNEEGFITTFGTVRGINTTGSLQGENWVDGDILFVSPTVPGGLTKVKPSAPNHLIIVGYVEYAHANNGKIFVHVQTSWELDELHNVAISNPVNNQVLKYNGTLWENATFPAVTSVGLATATSGVTITDTPVTSSGVININIATASASSNGLLSSADWATFNAKQSALTFGNISTATSGVTITNGNASTVGPNVSISIATAGSGQNGLLSAADWATFNAKQSAITLTTTGNSGAATFVGSTLNIPNYTLAGLGGVPTTRSLTINGTAYDLSADRTWSVGTVTSVAALTIGTAGTDITSTVATGTTTPVITLNVPTASAANRGALSAADWTTFNAKVSGSGTTNYVPKFTGSTTLGNSIISDNGTSVFIGGSGEFNNAGELRWKSTAGTGQNVLMMFSDNNVYLSAPVASSNLIFRGVGFAERMRITSGGDVGISQPSLLWTATNRRLLELNGTSQSLIGLNVNSLKAGYIWQNGNDMTIATENAGYIQFGTNGASDRMRIFSNGRVGINTTTDAGYQLDVNGSIRATSTIRSDGNFYNESANPAYSARLNTIDGQRINMEMTGTNGRIQVTRNSGAQPSLIFATEGGENMRIAPTGNVGVGTASPSYRIDAFVNTNGFDGYNVYGQQGGVNEVIGFRSTQGNGIGLIMGTTGVSATSAVGGPNQSVIYSVGSQNLILGTNSADRLRISSAGVITVANLAGSGARVVVADASGNLSATTLSSSVTTGSGTTNYVTKWTGASTQGNSLIFDDGTSVGVGTTSPSAKLHIQGSEIRIQDNNSNINFRNAAGTRTGYIQSRADAFDIWNDQAVPMVFGTNNTERLRITSDGNVGIGTVSPAVKLEIAGSGTQQIRIISASGADMRMNADNVGRSGTYSNSDYIILTNSSERLRITSGGDVGIGGIPLDKFTIFQDQNATTTTRVRNSDAGTSAYSQFVVNASGNSWGFRMGSSAANSNALDIVSDAMGSPASRLRIFANGRIGVNTTTDAGYQFDVNGTFRTSGSAISQLVINTTNASGAVLNHMQSGSSVGWLGNGSSALIGGSTSDYGINSQGSLFLATGAYRQATITLAGDMGIGTSSPSYKLDVNGTLRSVNGANFATSSGSVGVGVDTVAAGYKMQIEGNPLLVTRPSTPNDTTQTMFVMQAGSDATLGPIGGGIGLRTSASGANRWMEISAGDNAANRNIYFPRANVGIGDTSASYKLDVTGTLRSTLGANFATTSGNVGIRNAPSAWASTTPALQILNGSLYGFGSTEMGMTANYYFDGTNFRYISTNPLSGIVLSGGAINFISDASGTAGAIASGSTRMQMKNDGKLLINTTTDAGDYKLQVSGNIYNTGSAVLAATSGNVGIGTASPSQKLSIFSSGAVATYAAFGNGSTTSGDILIGSNAGGDLNLFNPNATDTRLFTSGNERMRIFSNGRVGINTTTDAGYQLDVNGSIRASGLIRSQATVGNTNGYFQLDHPGAQTWKLGVFTDNTSTFSIGNDLAGTFASRYFNITNAGNVGIGTTSPNARVEINSGGAGASVLLINSTPTTYTIDQEMGSLSIGSSFGGTNNIPVAIIKGFNTTNNSSTDGYLTLSTRRSGTPTEAVRITSTGNVGIGTTSPTERLDVRTTVVRDPSSGEAHAAFYTNAAQSIDRGAQITLGGGVNNAGTSVSNFATIAGLKENSTENNTAGTLSFWTRVSGGPMTRKMTIASDGNVGIGTQSPGHLFDIQKNQNAETIGRIYNTSTGALANSQLRLENSSSKLDVAIRSTGAGTFGALDAGSSYIWYNGTTSLVIGATDASGIIKFNTGGTTERMRIFANGRVAINTTTDAGYQLDVNGGTRVTGKITVTANDTLGLSIARAGTSAIASEIYNGGGDNGWLLYGVESSAGGVIFPGTTAYASVFGSFRSVPVQFATNNAVRMTIDGGGSVGIGVASPSASAILQVDSTTKGMLPPRMTTTQRDAITSPATGLIVYDTTVNKLSVYNGTTWKYAQYE